MSTAQKKPTVIQHRQMQRCSNASNVHLPHKPAPWQQPTQSSVEVVSYNPCCSNNHSSGQQLIHVQVDGAALLSEVEHVPHTRPSSRHEASSSSEPQVAYTNCLSLHHTVLQLLLPHDMGAPLLPFKPYTACNFGRLGLCAKHHTLQFWDIETSHKAPHLFAATCAIAAAAITYLHCKVPSSHQSALSVVAA